MLVVDELDKKSAFSAIVRLADDPLESVMTSVNPNREQLYRELDGRILIRADCDYMGVGQSEADGKVLTHAVYAFPTQPGAEKALPMVEEA